MKTITPDMLVLIAAAVAVALELAVPFGPAPGLTAPLSWLGALIAIAGFALEIAAARTLVRGGTSAKPDAAPTALVTTGPFARSRNPFYLGLLLVLLGIFIALGLEWGILASVGVWLAFDRIVVPKEEDRLRAFDPAAFDHYRSSVRRWL